MIIQKASVDFAESYCRAVDTIARERKYLGSTTGFPVESTIDFVGLIVRNNWPQYYAIEDGEVVGWCDAIPKSYEGLTHVSVLGMGVLAPFRGKGLGSQLLEKIIEHSRNNGIEKIELDVYESNQAAIGLYEKFGFFSEGSRINGRKLDGVYDHIKQMGKFL
ncbi:MAG TPA: GNAT family N-acetyltransferase [Prolixibacteraceae bacterium]|nr:GNAT family N-acetyltransferase [Prolixibacteraceae bacterium]